VTFSLRNPDFRAVKRWSWKQPFFFFSNLLFAIPQENQRNLVNYVLWEENESVDTDLAEIHCPSLAGVCSSGLHFAYAYSWEALSAQMPELW